MSNQQIANSQRNSNSFISPLGKELLDTPSPYKSSYPPPATTSDSIYPNQQFLAPRTLQNWDTQINQYVPTSADIWKKTKFQVHPEPHQQSNALGVNSQSGYTPHYNGVGKLPEFKGISFNIPEHYFDRGVSSQRNPINSGQSSNAGKIAFQNSVKYPHNAGGLAVAPTSEGDDVYYESMKGSYLDLYESVITYFGDLQMTKLQEDSKYSIYAAAMICHTHDRRYVFAFTKRDNEPLGIIKKLSTIQWVSFQTRQTSVDHHLPQQEYPARVDRFGKAELHLISDDDGICEYECRSLPIKVQLLGKNKKSMGYSPTGKLTTALETFNTVVTLR